MSARPGRILETRDVGFARPRTLESSYAPEFASLVQQLRMRIAEARRDGDATPPPAVATPATEEVAA
jgi:NitT/TauT family transport system ATP-binding protein